MLFGDGRELGLAEDMMVGLSLGDCTLSRVQLFVTPRTAACQVPLSMGLSRQEYWSGLPCPPPGDLPGPGRKHRPPALAGGFFTTSATMRGLVPLQEKTPENLVSASLSPSLPLLCAREVRRRSSASQEESPHQESTLGAP